MNTKYRIYMFCAICFYLSAIFWFVNTGSSTRFAFGGMYLAIGTMWLVIAQRFKARK